EGCSAMVFPTLIAIPTNHLAGFLMSLEKGSKRIISRLWIPIRCLNFDFHPHDLKILLPMRKGQRAVLTQLKVELDKPMRLLMAVVGNPMWLTKSSRKWPQLIPTSQYFTIAMPVV